MKLIQGAKLSVASAILIERQPSTRGRQPLDAAAVRTVLGAPEPCPRLLDVVERPASLSGYSEGRLLEDALRDAHFTHYAGG